jgi:hypothetical protein
VLLIQQQGASMGRRGEQGQERAQNEQREGKAKNDGPTCAGRGRLPGQRPPGQHSSSVSSRLGMPLLTGNLRPADGPGEGAGRAGQEGTA